MLSFKQICHRRFWLALAVFALSVWPPAARAELVVDVNQGVVKPIPIAVPDFLADTP